MESNVHRSRSISDVSSFTTVLVLIPSVWGRCLLKSPSSDILAVAFLLHYSVVTCDVVYHWKGRTASYAWIFVRYTAYQTYNAGVNVDGWQTCVDAHPKNNITINSTNMTRWWTCHFINTNSMLSMIAYNPSFHCTRILQYNVCTLF